MPSVVPDIPIPVDKIPAQQGTDLDYVKKLADDAGYVFYIDPGPLPGMNVGVLGTADQIRHPAARAQHRTWMPGPTSSRSASATSRTIRVMPIVTIQEPSSRSVPIPIPIPTGDAARIRRSACFVPIPVKTEALDRCGQPRSGPGADAGHGARGGRRGRGQRQRHAGRAALRKHPEGAPARRRARRGRGLRRPALRRQRHAHHQARVSTSRTSRSSATR